MLVIILILVILIGGTIAYFGWSTTSEGISSTIDVTVSGGNNNYCSKASDNDKLLLPVSSRDKGRIITMSAKQESSTNAFISWSLTINAINTSTTTTNGLKNTTFKYELINTTTGVSYGKGDFSRVTEGTTITFTAEETIDYGKEYTFTLYLWIDGTMGVNPSDMAGQAYDFDISCSITGTDNKVYPPTLVGSITKLYDKSEKTIVTNNSIDYNYATSVNLMNDRLGGETTSLDGGNIRYYGANPNNYIYFNCDDYSNQSSDTCELWRIIGVFDNKVKIIRNTSLGSFSWDYDYNDGNGTTTSNNDWSTSSLQTLLNNQYYNSIDTTYYNNSTTGTAVNFNTDNTGLKNDATRNMIANMTWSLGGWNTYSVYSNDIYKYERGTKVIYGRPTSWNGKIALMYPSDYGYATDFSKCNSDLYNYRISTNSYACRTNDWLFNSALQWLLTPNSSSAGGAWNVNSSGRVYDDIGVYIARGVRPVLYLNTGISVEDGDDGSSDYPYRISS